LSDPDELIELGFDDYAYGSGVALIEWPEKLENPETPGLWVDLQRIDNERREIEFFLKGETNRELITTLQKNYYSSGNNLLKAEGV
jgi:tRNA threonylcarbamoyladenosine biosynthesis protein TsaE